MNPLKLLIVASHLIVAFGAMAQKQQSSVGKQTINDEPLAGKATEIPVSTATQIMSVSPVMLEAPGRVSILR